MGVEARTTTPPVKLSSKPEVIISHARTVGSLQIFKLIGSSGEKILNNIRAREDKLTRKTHFLSPFVPQKLHLLKLPIFL